MYEWDEAKNAANIKKHGVSFETASRIFENRVVTSPDDRFDYGEQREISIGHVDGVLFLIVAHTDREGGTRIISARRANKAEGSDMKKKHYDKEPSVAELAAMPDEDIDYSDIPKLGEKFWKNARIVNPDRTTPITLRVKKSVLEAYKALGKGYQTRMNAVLESYARTLRK